MMKMKYNVLAFLIFAIALTGCKENKTEIFGEWQLVEQCYGKDCTKLSDYGIDQMWTLADNVLSEGGEFMWEKKYEGFQMQGNVMNDTIVWSVSKNVDTLYTTNKLGEYPDTLVIVQLEKDTLALTSMLNNILVYQLFIRRNADEEQGK